MGIGMSEEVKCCIFEFFFIIKFVGQGIGFGFLLFFFIV